MFWLTHYIHVHACSTYFKWNELLLFIFLDSAIFNLYVHYCHIQCISLYGLSPFGAHHCLWFLNHWLCLSSTAANITVSLLSPHPISNLLYILIFTHHARSLTVRATDLTYIFSASLSYPAGIQCMYNSRMTFSRVNSLLSQFFYSCSLWHHFTSIMCCIVRSVAICIILCSQWSDLLPQTMYLSV